jgi:hypothetical protein
LKGITGKEKNHIKKNLENLSMLVKAFSEYEAAKTK